MLKLTPYEQEMLDGGMGPFKQAAMQKTVKYAQVLGAEELCEVTKATVFLGAHSYLDALDTEEYDEIFSTMLLCSDTVIPMGEFASSCAVQTCAAACDQYVWEPLNLSRELFEKNQKYLHLAKEAGASIAGSCTPYFSGWIPLKGEHFVTTESSNVLMCNAVFGACGNADGLEAAVWSAICGRTPKWGNHVPGNRYGTHVFRIACDANDAIDWDIIGHVVGEKLPAHGIPVITGAFARPDITYLKQFFASLATTSGAEMCHIVSVTPEADTLEQALHGREPAGVFTISQMEYDAAMAALCDAGSGPVELVSLGCPHYSLKEVQIVSQYLRGKRVKPGVTLYVWTDISIKAMADASGYTKDIEDAGGYLLTSGCPLVFGRQCYEGAGAMALDGAKQAHYIRSETKAKVYYGNKLRCIDAAITGRWEVNTCTRSY